MLCHYTMDKVENHSSLYPSLGEADSSATQFRLSQVIRLRDELKNEINGREALYKKYQRGVNVLDGVDSGATATGIVLGGVGTGLLATLIAAPVSPLSPGCCCRVRPCECWNKGSYSPPTIKGP